MIEDDFLPSLIECCSIMICIPPMFLMLEQMHYDDAYGAYFDFGNHTEKVCCLHVIYNLFSSFSSSFLF